MKLHLFKYLSPKHEGSWNLAFHEKKSLFFQQPQNFNDPWDCAVPPLIVPRQINTLKEIYFKIKQNKEERCVNEGWNRLESLPKPDIIYHFKRLFKESFGQLRSKVGVFSTSTIPDSELLWSHYANCHSGYCLYFVIDVNEYFENSTRTSTPIPVPVIYKENIQKWHLKKYFTEREKYLYNLLRYKSKAWSYEHEIRLLNENVNGFVEYPKRWLKGIISGMAAEEPFKECLRKIGEEIQVPVYSAIADDSDYKILIPDFPISGLDGERHYNEVVSSQVFDLNNITR